MINLILALMAAGNSPTLIEAIRAAGLTSNLKLCLDAADYASYPGTGQQWLDTSGNGYDFFRGTTGSGDAFDPTFNGPPGVAGPDTYWSTDGGDLFRYDTSNETWMNALHKDSAAFSVLCFVYVPNTSSDNTIFGTTATTAVTGIGTMLLLDSSERPRFLVANGSSFSSNITGTALSVGWHVLGLSVDEAAGAGFLYADGAYNQVSSSDTFTATYSSPSASNASGVMSILSVGNEQALADSGTKIAGLAIWQGAALTKGNFDAIYSQVRGRYGLS